MQYEDVKAILERTGLASSLENTCRRYSFASMKVLERLIEAIANHHHETGELSLKSASVLRAVGDMNREKRTVPGLFKELLTLDKVFQSELSKLKTSHDSTAEDDQKLTFDDVALDSGESLVKDIITVEGIQVGAKVKDEGSLPSSYRLVPISKLWRGKAPSTTFHKYLLQPRSYGELLEAAKSPDTSFSPPLVRDRLNWYSSKKAIEKGWSVVRKGDRYQIVAVVPSSYVGRSDG